MDYTATGVLRHVGEICTGVSKKTGQTWKSMTFVIETQERYPKLMHFNAMNDIVDKTDFQIGATYSVNFSISSREFNSKYYTELNCWRIEKK